MDLKLLQLIKEKTVEALLAAIFGIGAIMLAVTTWVLIEVYSLNGQIKELKATSDQHGGRLDRIASAIPVAEGRVAQQELAKPIEVAILVTEPARTATGTWVSAVHFLDAFANERSTYVVTLKGKEDRSTVFLVAGAARSLDETAISFEKLEQLSAQLGKPASAPGFIMAGNSYVLRKADADSKAQFDQLVKVYGAALAQKPPAKLDQLGTWEKLSAELAVHAMAYKPL